MRKEINEILNKWNPIGIDELIPLNEYSQYVSNIVLVIDDKVKLKKNIIDIIYKLGFDYDENDKNHLESVDNVVNQLTDCAKNLRKR